MAQGLQTRGQTQHDDPQVAAEGQQHFAHVFGLHLRAQGRVVSPMKMRFSGTRQALHMHQVIGLYGQLRQMRPKRFGNHLFGFVQVGAGVNQIGSRLHGHRAADVRQDGGHGIGMGEDVFPGVEPSTRDQGLGKSTGFGQGFALFGLSGGQHDGGQLGSLDPWK